ncbi:DUF370 domain-containing protein [Lentibacillus halophilus]|uniref:DUF370 domain-containing protein n=1 Tax=Lentibacillus halophilus TaxID=295065 RepID=A0ABN0Z8I1_9BACI
MFIHIGNDSIIQSDDIISIIDRNVAMSSSIMEEMLVNTGIKQHVFNAADDVKSVVITEDDIYCSSLSVATLKKRSGMTLSTSTLEDFSNELEE